MAEQPAVLRTLLGWGQGEVSNVGGVAVCRDGSIALTDGDAHAVLRVAVPAGGPRAAPVTACVTAGVRWQHGRGDGAGTAARFCFPAGLAALHDGTLVVADQGDRLRAVAPDGTVSTLAGDGHGTADGPGQAAQFGFPSDVAVRTDGSVIIADLANNAVRALVGAGRAATAADTTVSTVAGPATNARLSHPRALAALPGGSSLVCDSGNRRVVIVSAADADAGGAVALVAGSGASASTDGAGAAAAFEYPFSVAVDVAGTAAVADMAAGYQQGRLVAGKSTLLRLVELGSGAVRTLAIINDTDGAPATLARNSRIAIDGNGDIVVANEDGVHLITGTGLAAGWFPWSESKWSPTRACHCRDSSLATRAAVRTVLLVATRARLADANQHTRGGSSSRRSARLAAGAPSSLLQSLPALPAEMWHQVLRMLPRHEIGGR